jgi:hypothetical protein
MSTSNGAEARPIDSFASVVHATEERRADERQPRKFSMKITPVGGTRSLECTSENVSEGGCFTSLPSDAGFCVGQRCELEFLPEGETADLAGEVYYATVVRTESMPHGADPVLGAGLRFDQPLFF